MKFSIVIPTRNRLEYLKNAIQSVLLQDHSDWEVVVSDNDSDDDIGGYVASLNEPRICYSRTEQYISVTDNWNRALDLSTGEYVICIGDDDCLMQGALSLLEKMIKDHQNPEVVFSNGLQYVYPGVFSQASEGYLTTVGNWHLWGYDKPGLVDSKELKVISDESLNFKLHFSYNMQLLTLSREVINRFRYNGVFFHSPYPDFYAMTILFQKAERVLACPYPLTIIGLSPKSYGGMFFNNNEETSLHNLNVEKELAQFADLEKLVLPGTRLNTCWMFAMHSAVKNFQLQNVPRINVLRYRRLQLVEFLKGFGRNENRTAHAWQFFKKLYLWEKVIYGPYLWSMWLIATLFGERVRNGVVRRLHGRSSIHQNHINYKFRKNYYSIMEVFDQVSPLNCTFEFAGKY